MRGVVIFLMVFMIWNSGFAEEKLAGSIQIKGSDTMINLVQAWAEEFMKIYPSVFIAVTGGGSGTGIASLLSGTCDIASCSRQMKAQELALAKKRGINPHKIKVAMDGVVVAVNPQNPLDKLTIRQLRSIFTGKITNWSQLGGENREIVVLSREVNSGTHIYFKDHILGKNEEFSSSALLLPSSQAIVDEIAQNISAIGYYGMGYAGPTQKVLAIAKDQTSEYILPTVENVISGKYPISRPLFFYTNGSPEGVVKKFIEFVLSEEGQRIVKDLDFVPLKEDAQD